MFIKKPFAWTRNLISRPLVMLYLCAAFAFLNFVVNGNIYRLWNLNNEYQKMLQRMEKNQKVIAQLNQDIAKMKDPLYIERQAIEKLDLVEENDLIFVFPTEQIN
ncbi:MAG: septum formation initiator family protein [Bdellovibrionaceae bacterium]|nr:septum formation initiator family protein [Pseudobdellovibrionaceae bacterium]